MGLDADFTIHVHWGEKDPITGRGDTHPMKDGWPIQEQRLHVTARAEGDEEDAGAGVLWWQLLGLHRGAVLARLG